MAQTRPATPAAGVIALILLGGAIATAVATVMMIALLHQSDVLAEFRHSRGFYVLSCLLVGFFTGIGVMLTRPRGPAAPIAAAVAAIVALYVGNRIGLLIDALPGGLPGGDFFVDLLRYRFDAEDLLAPLLAGAIGGLRVAMVAKSLAPRQPSGQPFPHPAPGGYGHQYQPPPGRPPAPGQPPVPGYPPSPGQPPVSGQPPAPGQPYQPPPGPGQGAAPGSPQGGPPPNDGA